MSKPRCSEIMAIRMTKLGNTKPAPKFDFDIEVGARFGISIVFG